jgi:hypothetical protein
VSSVLSVIPVVARRVAANARLLAAVVVGAVIAAALLSTTSIYTDAIRDLGLSFALRQEGPDRLNPLIRSTSQPSRLDLYTANRKFIAESAQARLGPFLEGTTFGARSATFFPTPPGGSVSQDEARPRSHFQFLTGLEGNVRVSEGRAPQPRTLQPGQPLVVEAMIGAETARIANVRPGDEFDAHPFWRTDRPPVRVRVTGLVEPIDQGDPYWRGQTDLFYFPSSRWVTLPFFVPEETYLQALAAYLPDMSSDYLAVLYVDAGRIDARNAETVRLQVSGLDAALRSSIERTTLESSLAEVLATFDQKLFFTRIPLLVLVLQIAGIVLYYLFMVSTMLVERQAAEIALLKSRGATTRQVMQIYVLEGLAIGVIAVAAGPPLAAAVISLLGATPPFSGLSGGSYLEVRLTSDAYSWALLGAALAFAALVWPAYQATRRTVIQYKAAAARPPKEAAFTRYYLDLVLVALGIILFLELNRRGTLVTEKLFGEQTADPVRLLTPAFFILAVGVFFLRLFPLALRVLAFVVARLRGTAVLIGMWQLVRNPVHYSRLVLLLMLATAVGMFAASFGNTLDHSYEDRAAYEAGAPLRLAMVGRVDAAGPNELKARAAELTGAGLVSPALRLDGSLGGVFDRTSFKFLAVEPETFRHVAFFREDFSGRSLGGLMDLLAADAITQPGIVLPADARWLGVWVNPVNLNGRVALEARLSDATGRYLTYILGPDQGAELPKGWSFVVADLTRPVSGMSQFPFNAGPPRGPLRLEAVSVRFFSRVSALTGSMHLDDIQTSAAPTLPPSLATERMAFDAGRVSPGFADGRLLADFESIAGWEGLEAIAAEPAFDQLRQVPSGAGGFAVEVAWSATGGPAVTHGLRPRLEAGPIAVLASESFVRRSGIGPGETGRAFVAGTYLDIEVVGTFGLFPTLVDEGASPALIANLERTATAINRTPGARTVYPDELWMSAGPGGPAPTAAALKAGLLSGTLFDFEAIRHAQERDPLVAAGWEGILFISFAAILLLSALGFLIYSYLSAQRRNLEFAILRTMGFTRRQIATVVGFEQVFVIGMGMLAGTLMGLYLGTLMIRYTGLTETGEEVLPPMLLHVSWLTVGTAWSVLGLAFLVTTGIVVLLYSRLALHRVLRIGET